MTAAECLGDDLFGEGNYLITTREFQDGDTRTVVEHNVGWSSTCYVSVKVWIGRGDVWVEYYEGDVRRCREIIPTDDFDPEQTNEYIFPD